MYKTLVSFVMYERVLKRTPEDDWKSLLVSREPMEFIWDYKPTDNEIAARIKAIGDEEMGEIEVDKFEYSLEEC